MYPAETIAQVLQVAQQHDLWLLSDECYDELVFEGEHVSPLALDSDQRVITVGTFSKTYAMTGWRIGWLVAPPTLIGALTGIVAAQVNNLPLFVQRGAEAALQHTGQRAQEMFRAYRGRRDLTLEILRAHGRYSYRPEGAFYVLVNVSAPAGLTSIPNGESEPRFDGVRFVESLIAERGIAVAPGVAFGNQAAACVRVSLASSPETLRAGINGLLDFAAVYLDRA